MKLKYTLVLFIAFTSFTTTVAQNKIMAKAYFDKANESYESGKFEKALDFIKRTKEELNGKTNPDITYLEAMSHNYFDRNPTKTKELINLFLKNAYEDDDRVKEMADLLIYLDDPDNLCENGDKRNVLSYASNLGVKEVTYKNSNCKLWGSLYFPISFKKYILESIDDNYDKRKELMKYIEIFDDNENLKRKSFYKNGKETKTLWYKNGELVRTKEY